MKITCADVSTHLFPKSPVENVYFEQASVLALPDEWTERFCFANQKLLMGALRTIEWPTAIAQLFRVLKPGGWVQLCEADWLKMAPGFASPRSKPVLDMHAALLKSRGLEIDVAPKLEGWLTAAGFTNVSITVRPVAIGAKAGAGVHNADGGFWPYFGGILGVSTSRGWS